MTTVIEYIEESNADGYGVALINSGGIILSPYVDPSDYPHLMYLEYHEYLGNCIVNTVGETYLFILHSGVLEEKYNSQQKTISAEKSACSKGQEND